MKRQLKVGDLVIATDKEETVIGRITNTGLLIVKIDGSIFHRSCVTHREYEDQFESWHCKSVVTGIYIYCRDSESHQAKAANEAIFKMMEK